MAVTVLKGLQIMGRGSLQPAEEQLQQNGTTTSKPCITQSNFLVVTWACSCFCLSAGSAEGFDWPAACQQVACQRVAVPRHSPSKSGLECCLLKGARAQTKRVVLPCKAL